MSGDQKYSLKFLFAVFFFLSLFFVSFPHAYATDCGLRYYDGDKIVGLNCESLKLTNSPLRVRTSTGIWGITHVDLDHPLATKLHFAYRNPSTGATVLRAAARTGEGNEILLSSCEEFQLIGLINAFPATGKTYLLTQDLDCSSTNPSNAGFGGSLWGKGYNQFFEGVGYDGVPGTSDDSGPSLAEGWSPLGQTTPISGTIDGGGHTVSNVYAVIPPGNYGGYGLFSQADGAVIRNLHLRNLAVSQNIRVGSFVGVGRNIQIINCSATGSLFADRGAVGGLIGQCESSWCCGEWPGGIIGNCTIENSYFKGTISARNPELGDNKNSAGGLVGYGRDVRISSSYFQGNLITEGTPPGLGYTTSGAQITAGGLIGSVAGTIIIEDSFSVANFSTGNGLSFLATGGLIGAIKSGTSSIPNSWWFASGLAPTNTIGGVSDSTGKATAISDFYGTGVTGTNRGGAVYKYPATGGWFYATTNPYGAWMPVSGNFPYLKCPTGKSWNSTAQICK